MADTKEALPVVAWLMRWTGYAPSVTTDPSDYPHERKQGLLIPLCDHATATAAIAELRAEVERHEELAEKLLQWARAYPLSVFPEPDMARAHELLQAGGMTIDAISASNMRHVITRVEKMVLAARAGTSGGPSGGTSGAAG